MPETIVKFYFVFINCRNLKKKFLFYINSKYFIDKSIWLVSNKQSFNFLFIFVFFLPVLVSI